MTTTTYEPALGDYDLRHFADVDANEAIELACKAHLGVWAERKRGFVNAPHVWEWCELAMFKPRMAVCAPREHAKTEVFTVNQAAWRCTYQPGIEIFCFAQTGDMAQVLKERIDAAIEETAPWLLTGKNVKSNKTESTYSNWSKVRVAGAGKGVRGAHPDVILGDDVLSEGNTLTAHQREQTHAWWFGTIGGMSHPGKYRVLGREGDASAPRVWMPGTKVHLVGTPFHRSDLLMAMRDNPLYEFRRYAAEFRPEDLHPGTMAVEVS